VTAIERLRLFVAVTPPGPHLDTLSASVASWRDAAPPARWVAPDGQHVTLKFLGWTPSDRRAPLDDVLAMVAAGRRRARLSWGAVGAFPSPRRARVLWVGLDDPAGLLAGLAADLDAALEPLGWGREARPFTPHLTLARFRSPARLEQLPRLDDMAALPAFEVSAISLYRSRLHPSGARYELLERHDLV
jgi:RNA 2',3'-cyclic 3'-phosphodiesterase